MFVTESAEFATSVPVSLLRLLLFARLTLAKRSTTSFSSKLLLVDVMNLGQAAKGKIQERRRESLTLCCPLWFYFLGNQNGP